MSSDPRTPPNRLASEPSPYLRQHAGNPVDWYPWGDEALARAAREDKPILLSVGYSACHWCHVMAHESFEDPETAELMNRWFVNVKVDREERPDLDQLYQGVVQLMGRGGGWPLTVFLTPELRPFFGGTYFPRDPRYGMPAFRTVLGALHEAYRERRGEVQAQGGQFEAALGQLARHGLSGSKRRLTAESIASAGRSLLEAVDPVNGGFGSAPKFPNPMNVALLLRAWRRTGEVRLKDAALLTLERMAHGGIYDQLGGGFHRYSVDATWEVPHFEKMLYDNGQLIHLYSEAFQVEPRPLFREVIEATAAYVEREMTGPEGGFFAAQDADSEGEEGRFFAWGLDEVRALLSPGAAAAVEVRFGLTREGNFEHGRNVLRVRRSWAEVAAALGRPEVDARSEVGSALAVLRQAREKRVRPARDDKILAGWNGLMIRGLAFAARVFQQPGWARLAARAADFVLAGFWDGDRLARVHPEGARRVDGFLEDYGDLASGLTALFQETFDLRYLEAAHSLALRAVERFWDPGAEAYFTAPRGQKDLLVSPYALHDNAAPSGASTLCEAQVALASLTGDRRHLEQAERYLSRLAAQAEENPFAFGHLLLAGDSLVDGAREVTLVGDRAGVAPWLDRAAREYLPTTAWLVHDPKVPAPGLLSAVLEGRTDSKGPVTAYFCRHFSCQPPVTSWEALREQLEPGPPAGGSTSGV